MRDNTRMPKHQAKLHAVMGGTPDEVEAAFYEAMNVGDLEMLMTCWADEDEIACIHPGGTRLCGQGAIRAAFETLFAHGGAVRVRPEQIRRVESLASAVHHVLERVEVLGPEGAGSAYVIATNVYHKTPQGWRMVVHHASPGTAEDMAQNLSDSQILH